MMQELLADAIGQMDCDLVEEFVLFDQKLTKKKNLKKISPKQWTLVAASLLLVLGIGSGAAFHLLSPKEPVPSTPVVIPPAAEPEQDDSGNLSESISPVNDDFDYEGYLDFLTSKSCLTYQNGFVTYERVSMFGEFEKMNYWGYSSKAIKLTYFLSDRGLPIELLIQNYRNASALPKQEITDAVFDSCDMRKIISTSQYQFDESDKVGGCYYRIGDTYYIYNNDLRLQKIMICSEKKQYTLTVEDLCDYPQSGENAVIHNLLDREKAYAQIKALLTLWEAE